MDASPQIAAPLPRDQHRAPRRVTVVRPGALGDTLLTLPTLAALRRWAPEAHLTFIARADTLPLAQASGLADCAWSWDSPDWSVIFASEPIAVTEAAQSALGDADVVIVWASDPNAMIARRLASLGAKRVIVAPALPPEDATSAGEQAHIAVWLTSALAPLGIPTPSVESLAAMTPTLRAPASNSAEADALWHALRLPERVVALHPGSGSPRKRWPADRFADVARLACEAGYAPLLLAGEADEQALAETQAALARMCLRVDVAQGLRTATLAALLARCAGYIGCDSGVSHLAGLVGAPTVALFGPTDPARWAPLGPWARAVRSPDTLLDHLSADMAWAALHSLLASSGQP